MTTTIVAAPTAPQITAWATANSRPGVDTGHIELHGQMVTARHAMRQLDGFAAIIELDNQFAVVDRRGHWNVTRWADHCTDLWFEELEYIGPHHARVFNRDLIVIADKTGRRWTSTTAAKNGCPAPSRATDIGNNHMINGGHWDATKERATA